MSIAFNGHLRPPKLSCLHWAAEMASIVQTVVESPV
jgi:hypothetical protein